MSARSDTGAFPAFSSKDMVRANSRPAGADPSGGPDSQGYEHTQRGMVIIASVGIAIFLMVALSFLLGFVWITVLVFCILFFALALFSTLTVSVGKDVLKIRFGPLPLIRKSWPFAEIASAVTVINPWYYGWGIRWTPSGPLYNVSGYGAVEVVLHSGKRFRIGTDEPEALCRVIQETIKQGRKVD